MALRLTPWSHMGNPSRFVQQGPCNARMSKAWSQNRKTTGSVHANLVAQSRRRVFEVELNTLILTFSSHLRRHYSIENRLVIIS